jgi:hypothetical protein
MHKHSPQLHPFRSSQPETLPSQWQPQRATAACPLEPLPRVVHYTAQLQALSSAKNG